MSRPPAAPEAFLVPLALACGHGLSVARHGGRDPFPCPGWPGVRNSHIVSHWRNIRETGPNNPCSSFSGNASDILCSSLFIISDSNAVDDRTCKPPTLAKHSLSLNQHCVRISNLKLSTLLCTVRHIISCISKHVISTHEHRYINESMCSIFDCSHLLRHAIDLGALKSLALLYSDSPWRTKMMVFGAVVGSSPEICAIASPLRLVRLD